MLVVQADPRSPEHGQYSFVQDLVRHVAYETLSKRERRSRHLAAAEHIQSSFPDDEEVVEVLASRYLDAYHAAPDADDAPEIRSRGREMLTRAGERATSLAAAREAQRYFEQAAELADDAVARADLHDRAGQMAWRRGRSEEARSLFDQALTTFERADRVQSAARVSARWPRSISVRAARRVVARLEQALRRSPLTSRARIWRPSGELGRFLILNGQLEQAAPHLERALELAEALDLLNVRRGADEQSHAAHVPKPAHGERDSPRGCNREGAGERSACARAEAYNLGVVLESSDRYGEAFETLIAASTWRVAAVIDFPS